MPRPRKGPILPALLTVMLFAGGARGGDGLEPVDDLTPEENPGRIDMYRYVPATVGADPALIVLLHGCRQTAADFGDTGWFELAERTGALLLLPQQRRRNSLTRCWNWFVGADGADNREKASILALIARLRADYPVDPQRIFVAGLSAGGWMSSLLLAAHPALFEAGAIIAGGPAYCAFSRRPWWDPFGLSVAFWAWPAAFDCMDGVDLAPAEWVRRVRQHADAGTGPAIPRLSIWHGSEDDKVGIANVTELLEQWTALAGIDDEPDGDQAPAARAGLTRRVYAAADGVALLETVIVDGMGHVMPIDQRNDCGAPGAYVEDRGLCAATMVAKFWNLPGS